MANNVAGHKVLVEESGSREKTYPTMASYRFVFLVVMLLRMDSTIPIQILVSVLIPTIWVSCHSRQVRKSDSSDLTNISELR